MKNIVATNVNTTMTNHISLPRHNVSMIKTYDEGILNASFDTLSHEMLQSMMKKRLPVISKKRHKLCVVTRSKDLAKVLKNIINNIGLLDEHSFEKRVQLFVGYCIYKNYSYNTTMTYFMALKKHGIFGDINQEIMKPKLLSFVDRGKLHIRIVNMDDFILFVRYLNNNLSRYTAPLLVAAYTVLRSSEILQFSAYTLYQLNDRQSVVVIKLKQTVVKCENPEPLYWHPVYNTLLDVFIDNLTKLYTDEYNALIKHKINVKLFYITQPTLANRLKSLYFEATKKIAPHGFGIHSFRNMIAILMAKYTDNIIAIKEQLNHKNINTTMKYIREDGSTTKEFNRITKKEFAHVRNVLKQS